MPTNELLELILNEASKNNYPDVHIVTNQNVRVRNKSWKIEKLKSIWDTTIWILDKETIKNIIIVLVWEEWYKNFVNTKELDTSHMISSWERYRINCYMDSNWYSIAFRIIPNNIPEMESLWLWNNIKELCSKNKWLILVTWPTGSGKSTNLASMINYINNNMNKHIITIEDPIEFAFNSNKSLINQREIWSHTNWFWNAIRASLREDPDVIMIWEMRDPETIKAAITLAETGHLVLSTLHTNDSVQTIDRIVDIFPWAQQSQIRMQLSQSLAWIISQKLISRDDKEWRIAVREILINNDATKNLIITGKTNQIYSVIEVSKNEWMILMDKYLLALYAKKIISKDTLMSYVRDKEWISMMID